MRESAIRRNSRKAGGANHLLWVVSYADMITLLLALFVVLYSLGEVKLRKLIQLRRSLAFAFKFEGGEGVEGDGAIGGNPISGDVIGGVELINAQSGPMREYLFETLPERFEEVTGRSLEVVVTDNTISFAAPLSAFYEPGQISPEEGVQIWLIDLMSGMVDYASHTRVRIEAPNVVVGRDRNRNSIRSASICLRRLDRLLKLLALVPHVDIRNVHTEFGYIAPGLGDWEDQAKIRFAFSN
jgi:hypothetical protein